MPRPHVRGRRAPVGGGGLGRLRRRGCLSRCLLWLRCRVQLWVTCRVWLWVTCRVGVGLCPGLRLCVGPCPGLRIWVCRCLCACRGFCVSLGLGLGVLLRFCLFLVGADVGVFVVRTCVVVLHRVAGPDIRTGVLGLAARAICNEQGQFEYDFYCERQTFAWSQLRQDVFYATARYILNRRRRGERYPVFITDLNLEACREHLSSTKELQLSHYLRIKIDLERRLSLALKTLS